jgi:hypothetical protein
MVNKLVGAIFEEPQPGNERRRIEEQCVQTFHDACVYLGTMPRSRFAVEVRWSNGRICGQSGALAEAAKKKRQKQSSRHDGFGHKAQAVRTVRSVGEGDISAG